MPPSPCHPRFCWLRGASMGSLLSPYMGMDIAVAERGPLVQKECCVVCVWLYLYILIWYVQSVITGLDQVSCVKLYYLRYVILIIIFNILNYMALPLAVFPLSRRVHLHARLFIGHKWNEGEK